MDWLDLFAIQGTLKSLLQHHSSKSSILRCPALFMVQLSHPYMTTGKTTALTRQTFVGKVMSQDCFPLNTLSQNFPGSLVFKNLPADARDTSLNPGPGTKIPDAMGQLTEACVPGACSPPQEKPPQPAARGPQLESSSPLTAAREGPRVAMKTQWSQTHHAQNSILSPNTVYFWGARSSTYEFWVDIIQPITPGCRFLDCYNHANASHVFHQWIWCILHNKFYPQLAFINSPQRHGTRWAEHRACRGQSGGRHQVQSDGWAMLGKDQSPNPPWALV